MIRRFRKKPVVIEAMLWDGGQKSAYEIVDWSKDAVTLNPSKRELLVKTLEGTLHISTGDYVIKGVQGELYPCKPDIFNATYEEVM